MTKRCVVDEDVFSSNAVIEQIGFEDIVRGARIDIVGAQKREFFNTQFFKEIVSCGDRLLVRSSTGVEDVFGAFFAFILHGIEHQAIQFFQNRKGGLAGNRGPRPEDHIHFSHGQQFACFFCKEGPVRRRIDNDSFDFASQKTTGRVLRFNQQLHSVFQGSF